MAYRNSSMEPMLEDVFLYSSLIEIGCSMAACTFSAWPRDDSAKGINLFGVIIQKSHSFE